MQRVYDRLGSLNEYKLRTIEIETTKTVKITKINSKLRKI